LTLYAKSESANISLSTAKEIRHALETQEAPKRDIGAEILLSIKDKGRVVVSSPAGGLRKVWSEDD
jgi:hypothetical protein